MNPFIFGVVVHDQHYCQRVDLEKRIRERLLSGQNIYLLGPRRVGKTSLVERVATRHFKKRFIRVDFMTVKTPEEASEWILNAWLAWERANRRIAAALEFITSLNIDVSILGNRIKVDPGNRLARLSFDQLFDRLDRKPSKGQPPLLLFFDEFQALLDLDQEDRFEFLGRLRKGIQHLKHVRVAYAGSVRHAIHEIFQHVDSPFYSAAEPIEVGPISPSTRFHKFLTKKFAEGDRHPDEAFWQTVSEITGDNPSDTQRLCAAVWETSQSDSSLDSASVDAGLTRIFEHEQQMNLSIIEQSTAIQKRCLVGIATHGGHSPTSAEFRRATGVSGSASVLKALDRYIKLGILSKGGTTYHFTNPFFQRWLIERQP